MSAIAGIVRFDGAPIAPGSVEKMTAAMAGRGPDGIRHWARGPAALGQCMFRTTPESVDEVQPLANEDHSLVLVMDGRVDDREGLRRALLGRGATLRDSSDAELVLRAYETWGEECPDRIIGELVFFVWDARNRRLFGARDAAGTRHFYYHAGNGWFAFASEIRALLALGAIEARLNESRLLDYVVIEFDRDDEVGTFYQDIERLPAGHAMGVAAEGPRTWRYWDPSALAEASFRSVDECAEALREQLRVVVKSRLRSNGPVGAMLSGGLDSSSIVGLISKEFRGELAEPLRTYSLVGDDRCLDGKAVETILREDHWLRPTIIGPAGTPEACAAALAGIRNLDEPFSLWEAFPESLIYAAARHDGCRAIIDGFAGDLLFYAPGRQRALGLQMLARLPAILAARHRHGPEQGLAGLARQSVGAFAPPRMRQALRTLRDRYAPLRGGLAVLRPQTARRFLAEKRSQRERAEGGAPLDDCARHARRFMSGMLSFAHEVQGQVALSHGVEPRSPLSDRRMLEFAVRMPVQAKLYAPWYKLLLRQSMAGILPEEVRWRRDIGGHPGWKFYEAMIARIPQCAPAMWNRSWVEGRLDRWVDGAGLRRAWHRYTHGGDYASGAQLFALVVLAQWMDTGFKGARPADIRPRFQARFAHESTQAT